MKPLYKPERPSDLYVGTAEQGGDVYDVWTRGEYIILCFGDSFYKHLYSSAKTLPRNWIWRKAADLVDLKRDPSISPNSGGLSGPAGS